MSLAISPGALPLPERLRGWLARAPAPVFALYGGLMAFGAYFAMYGFRRPFSVASFADAAPVLVEYKIALVIAQVFGYALAFGDTSGGAYGWNADLFMLSSAAAGKP